jgi:hypothetical protein
MRTGPTTKQPTAVGLGLAEVRVGLCSTYIGQRRAILPASASVGNLAETKFISMVEVYRLLSGSPELEDAIYPLSEIAAMEIAFLELTSANFALSRGLNPSSYPNAHTGEIKLGTIASPTDIRVEMIYTYPDKVNTMTFVFPRAQVVANIDMAFSAKEPAAISLRIESKRADDGIAQGHVIWNDSPLGYIRWDDGTQTTTTSSSSTTTTTTTTA